MTSNEQTLNFSSCACRGELLWAGKYTHTQKTLKEIKKRRKKKIHEKRWGVFLKSKIGIAYLKNYSVQIKNIFTLPYYLFRLYHRRYAYRNGYCHQKMELATKSWTSNQSREIEFKPTLLLLKIRHGEGWVSLGYSCPRHYE